MGQGGWIWDTQGIARARFCAQNSSQSVKDPMGLWPETFASGFASDFPALELLERVVQK